MSSNRTPEQNSQGEPKPSKEQGTTDSINTIIWALTLAIAISNVYSQHNLTEIKDLADPTFIISCLALIVAVAGSTWSMRDELRQLPDSLQELIERASARTQEVFVPLDSEHQAQVDKIVNLIAEKLSSAGLRPAPYNAVEADVEWSTTIETTDPAIIKAIAHQIKESLESPTSPIAPAFTHQLPEPIRPLASITAQASVTARPVSVDGQPMTNIDTTLSVKSRVSYEKTDFNQARRDSEGLIYLVTQTPNVLLTIDPSLSGESSKFGKVNITQQLAEAMSRGDNNGVEAELDLIKRMETAIHTSFPQVLLVVYDRDSEWCESSLYQPKLEVMTGNPNHIRFALNCDRIGEPKRVTNRNDLIFFSRFLEPGSKSVAIYSPIREPDFLTTIFDQALAEIEKDAPQNAQLIRSKYSFGIDKNP